MIAQDDYFDNNKDDSQTQCNDEDNSEDEDYNELYSSQQLNGMESNKIINQENQILLIVGSSNSTSIFVNKHNGITNTSTPIQGLFLQYLHKVVITILCIQPSLPVSLLKNIIQNLYKGFSNVIYLLLSLLISLRDAFLHSFLLVSLRSEII